jgi:hypothetical protein
LTGGPGGDLFRFNAATDGGVKGGDAITDFVRGLDRIALDHTGFGLAGTGSLASQGVAFVRGNAATSSDPTVIVRPFTNDVWWGRRRNRRHRGAAPRACLTPGLRCTERERFPHRLAAH